MVVRVKSVCRQQVTHILSELAVDALQIGDLEPAPPRARRDPSQRPRLDVHQLGRSATDCGRQAMETDAADRVAASILGVQPGA